MGAVHEAAPPSRGPFVDLVPQPDIKLTPRHYSYLKISEGCNHACAFCIIPQLRGPLASRRIDAVLREAEKLVEAGTRELLVISQDTSAYGVDTRHEARQWQGREVRAHMTDLARELGGLRTADGTPPWVRLPKEGRLIDFDRDPYAQMAEKLGRDGYVWAHYPELPKKAFDAKLAIDESYTYHAFNLRTQYAANGIYYLVFISPLHLKTFRDVIRRVYGTKPGRRRNRYPATGIFR